LGSLVVTHPFHPLRGERLDVLFVCCRGASRVYVCDGGPLGGMALPEDATDRGPESAERSLCFEALAELASVVAALLDEQGMRR
jgi:Family of unknown function (DUF5372)